MLIIGDGKRVGEGGNVGGRGCAARGGGVAKELARFVVADGKHSSSVGRLTCRANDNAHCDNDDDLSLIINDTTSVVEVMGMKTYIPRANRFAKPVFQSQKMTEKCINLDNNLLQKK